MSTAGKSLQENGLIQVIWIKRRNAERERDFEDWEPSLANLQASQACPWLCMLRALPHVPGNAESHCSTGTEPVWLARMGPSQPAPGEGTAREQQPTWAAHVSAVPARVTKRPLPPETAPLMASGEARASLLITLQRSFYASIQWLMVEQDNKASQDEKACRKATWPSSGNWRLLISRGEERDNQNSNF